MNQWQKRFDEHGLHGVLGEIEELVTSAEVPSEDPSLVEGFNRATGVYRYVRQRLGMTDPKLVLPQSLDQLLSSCTNLRNHLRNFLANQNVGQLNNANAQADQMLAQVTTLPMPVPAGAEDLVSTAKEFSRLSSDLVTNLKAKSEEVSTQLQERTRDMAKLESRTQQHDQTLEQQKARMDSVISELQKQFSDAEERRRSQFETATNQRTSEFQETQEEMSQRIEAFFSERGDEFKELEKGLNEKSKALIDALEEKRKEASDLVHVVGNIGVTGQYDNHAVSDRQAADRWRRIALIFMSALVVGAVVTVTLAFLGKEPDWKMTLVRMFTTLTFAIPAFYAARESLRHRRTEQRYRKMQLELASLDPFLEKLPEEKRHLLKEKLTERFFGQPEPIDKEDEPVTSGTLFDLLKMVLQNLTKK